MLRLTFIQHDSKPSQIEENFSSAAIAFPKLGGYCAVRGQDNIEIQKLRIVLCAIVAVVSSHSKSTW